jgi:aldehyde dehydrogenase (NAD+)
MINDPITNIAVSDIFAQQSQFKIQTRNWTVAHRKNLLRILKQKVEENEKQICQALYSDFKKSEFEVLQTEIYPVLHEIRLVISKLSQWSRAKKIKNDVVFMGAKSYILPQAKGQVLIISP